MTIKIEDIARTCHAANAAYCSAIGDFSQKPWSAAEPWQRESAIKGVEFIRDNPHALPSASHESWLEEKRRTGWKYGPVKDTLKKEHPCFVPYEELPVEQKAKDYIFGAIARTLLLLERYKQNADEPVKESLVAPQEKVEQIPVDPRKVVAHTPQEISSVTTIDDAGKRTVDLSKLTSK